MTRITSVNGENSCPEKMKIEDEERDHGGIPVALILTMMSNRLQG
jgi:hypothetical protein